MPGGPREVRRPPVTGRRLLLRLIRPYAARLVLTITATVAATLLQGFSLVLLIPFLRALFARTPASDAVAPHASGVEVVLRRMLGLLGAQAAPATALYEVVSGGLSIQYQAITLTPPGYAHGRKTARKTIGRKRDGRCSRSAIPSPRPSLSSVVPTKYTTVVASARQKKGSASIAR
jgi:hypothetical protein